MHPTKNFEHSILQMFHVPSHLFYFFFEFELFIILNIILIVQFRDRGRPRGSLDHPRKTIHDGLQERDHPPHALRDLPSPSTRCVRGQVNIRSRHAFPSSVFERLRFRE